MADILHMLASHPRPSHVDMDALVACIQECFDCAETCVTCADACLSEKEVQPLLRCVRQNLDCADVCSTTGRLLARQFESDWVLLSSQIQACITACQVCGEECRRHQDHHEHCKVCAQACDRCGQACMNLLAIAPQVATA